MTPRIAIIGAGPGGLTLARILQRNSISTSVYEHDPSPDYRPQGGTLDLHVHSGQQALRDAGLWDEFLKHARYDAQVMKIIVKSGEIVFQDEPNPDGPEGDEHARPEIDRTALRAILLEAFGAENVAWNHVLASVQPAADNKFDLHFKNGKVETGFDLVVGADGAWSSVRPLLTTVKPFYSGISSIEFNIPKPKGEKYDTINKLVGAGNAFAFSDGKSIQAQRLGTGAIRVYAGYNTELGEANWLDKFDTSNPSALKTELLTYFHDWSSELQDLIRLSDDSALKRALHMFPVGHSWESRPGVTLVGDAAHLMTPYAGEGVNLAMWDSLELSRKIVAGVQSGNLSEQVQEYEVNMFKTAADSARRTDRNKVALFAKDFPMSMAQMMQEMQAGQDPRSGPGGPARD
ncbi:monooxygenase FAD-binding protein [Ceratobasidium sp. AG-I]|nr:monooxygenase FAD-binding protein [Ceratobasidium sp. AG-I]